MQAALELPSDKSRRVSLYTTDSAPVNELAGFEGKGNAEWGSKKVNWEKGKAEKRRTGRSRDSDFKMSAPMALFT